MVKLTGPLFSNTASGTLADALTFSHRTSGAQVRTQRKQKDRVTALRTAQRAKFLLGLDLWRSMPDNERDYWKLVESQGFVNI